MPYDTHAHPSVRRYWSDIGSNEDLGSHPVLSKHGEDLSREGFKHSHDLHGGPPNMMQLMQLMQRLIQLERAHAQELIQLAKKVTVQIWNVPEEMLDAKLGPDDIDINDTEEFLDNMDDLGDEAEALEHVQPADVHKRLTLNMFTHGSAVHAMMSAHHLVNQELKKIDPDILKMYTQIASGAHANYWMLDLDMMLSMLKMSAAGSVKIEYPDNDDEGDDDEFDMEDEGAMPVIHAKGWIFPILVQELFKGVAELLSHHGLQDYTEPQAKSILNQADKIELEPVLIQIGPEAWRRLLKAMPKGTGLADAYKALASLPPDDLHRVVDVAMSNPEQAAALLSKML